MCTSEITYACYAVRRVADWVSMGPDLDPAYDQGADPHQSNADPNPAFYFTANQDLEPVPLLSDGNLRPLSIDPPGLHFEPPGLHCERPRTGHPRLYFSIKDF